MCCVLSAERVVKLSEPSEAVAEPLIPSDVQTATETIEVPHVKKSKFDYSRLGLSGGTKQGLFKLIVPNKMVNIIRVECLLVGKL